MRVMDGRRVRVAVHFSRAPQVWVVCVGRDERDDERPTACKGGGGATAMKTFFVYR